MVAEKKSLQKDVADLEAELQLEAAGDYFTLIHLVKGFFSTYKSDK